MELTSDDFQELENYGIKIKTRDKKKRIPRLKVVKPNNKKKKSHRGGFNKHEHDWDEVTKSSGK
jgi:hypothetical protein